MPQFMLLLHDGPASFAKMSPTEMQSVVQRYVAWSQRLRARGTIIEGKKLAADPGRVMRRKGHDVLVTDGPFAESKEVTGGYFLIDASDYDEAVALATDCPHLDYQGTIEVRRVDAR